MGRFLKTVSTSCWLSGSSWLIVIWPKQLNSTVFTETRTLNLQRTQVAQYYAPDRQRATEFQLEGFAWREAVITGAPPEVFLQGLPSDGWRVLPADLQVCPPIWRAGGRLANTLIQSDLDIIRITIRKWNWSSAQLSTHKQWEMHRCMHSTVATDVVMLKHQAINVHSARSIVLDLFWFRNNTFITTLENKITF